MNAAAIQTRVEQWKAALAVAGKPNEWEGKHLAQEMGIAIPGGLFVRPDEDLASIETSALSFPCVVKVCSGDVLHKTDEGGVLLHVAREGVAEAVQTIRRRFPDTGVLIEEMVGYKGTEVIIGALHDPSFGPAVMVGAGGILTELYKDVSFRLAPCPKAEALRMIRELIIAPALEGFRGLPANIEPLADTVEKVADLAAQLIDEGCQLDINPIVWSGDRWVALDVKVII